MLGASLDEAALLVAAHARDGLDVDRYLGRLDLSAVSCPAGDGSALLRHVFEVERYAGDDETYYDPRNSYLDEVIDRRVGIPITLALVLMSIGRRVGVAVEGIGMPGHFLARVDGIGLVDPYERGRRLSLDECEARFRLVYGAEAPFDESLLEVAAPHAIVARVLANLRQVHLSRRDSASLEWVLRLRSLLPGATLEERAERAGVLAALGRYPEAAGLLEELARGAPEATASRLLKKARAFRARMN